MKALYQFLIVCSVFILTLQEDCKRDDDRVTSYADCKDLSPTVNGYKCCFYEGRNKKDGEPMAYCNSFNPDDIKNHKKEVINRLKGGTYFTKTTDTDKMMSFFNESSFQCSRGSYISIRLLIFVSLLSLLF